MGLAAYKKKDQKPKEKTQEEEGGQVLDGPSRRLLEHMKGYDYIAPHDWPGHRPLTGV